MRNWILALALTACATDDSVNPAVLIRGGMDFDRTFSAGFVPAPGFHWEGDTAVFRDYFALSSQPQYVIKAELSGDTLYFDYQAQPGASADWMPTVEAVMRVRLDPVPDSLWIRFPIVASARPPRPSETGFRNATQPLLIRVGLRR